MRPIEFYIDGFNHELNLYLLSAQILDAPKQGELFGLFTCGADHDGYSIVVDESATFNICNDQEFKRIIESVIAFRKLRAEKNDFVKMKFYEQARVLRDNEQILIDDIFSVQRKLFFSELFFEKLDETTIGMKVFSNVEFQNSFISALLYYQKLSERKNEVLSS